MPAFLTIGPATWTASRTRAARNGYASSDATTSRGTAIWTCSIRSLRENRPVRTPVNSGCSKLPATWKTMSREPNGPSPPGPRDRESFAIAARSASGSTPGRQGSHQCRSRSATTAPSTPRSVQHRVKLRISERRLRQLQLFVRPPRVRGEMRFRERRGTEATTARSWRLTAFESGNAAATSGSRTTATVRPCRRLA